ncbi:MAG: sulfotransferase domain-containing protein [Bacteroidetes bacterium]|nr:sulfotransferase domain-containing protein [Bacteroidota bacterium]
MSLPKFLCVGTSKSGTTSLHSILAQHPEICLPEQKEIHFFDNDENFKKGVSWYEEQFKQAGPGQLVGEITPDYMFYDYAPKRILDLLGNDIKLILMLRNPVDRAYSEYLFNVRRGYFDKPFEQVIEEEKKFDLNKFENRHFIHIHRSMYAVHIQNLQKYFTNSNHYFYIIFEEDFKKNQAQTIERLLGFLGVSQQTLDLGQVFKPAYMPKSKWLQKIVYQPNMFKKVIKNFLPTYKIRRKIKDQWLPGINSSKEKIPAINPDLKKLLLEKYFFDDIRKTEDLIKRDLSVWLK